MFLNRTFFRFAASYHDRCEISSTTKAWYGITKRHMETAGPRQFKQDEEYESAILVELQSSGVFNPAVHPLELYNIVTKDVATAEIEQSLRRSTELGRLHLEIFVSQRLVSPCMVALVPNSGR